MRKQNSLGADAADEPGVSGQLERIGRILAMAVIRNENQQEQVKFLSAVGYSPTQIGEMLKTSANAISVALVRLKKKR